MLSVVLRVPFSPVCENADTTPRETEKEKEEKENKKKGEENRKKKKKRKRKHTIVFS